MHRKRERGKVGREREKVRRERTDRRNDATRRSRSSKTASVHRGKVLVAGYECVCVCVKGEW